MCVGCRYRSRAACRLRFAKRKRLELVGRCELGEHGERREPSECRELVERFELSECRELVASFDREHQHLADERGVRSLPRHE